MPSSNDPQPMYAIYDETETYYRENPSEAFIFMPVGSNAHKQGRLVCFRRVADLPEEARTQGPWEEVVWRDRRCPKWLPYEPGIAPREQLAENRSRQFELEVRGIEDRLTKGAIILGAIIGVAQILAAVLAVTPDSVGCQLVKNVGSWFGALSWLTCK